MREKVMSFLSITYDFIAGCTLPKLRSLALSNVRVFLPVAAKLRTSHLKDETDTGVYGHVERFMAFKTTLLFTVSCSPL